MEWLSWEPGDLGWLERGELVLYNQGTSQHQQKPASSPERWVQSNQLPKNKKGKTGV